MFLDIVFALIFVFFILPWLPLAIVYLVGFHKVVNTPSEEKK